MAIDPEQYRQILSDLGKGVQLVAVSKTKPPEDIRALYEEGQRDFGENYVQELEGKQGQLPSDIRWHFIGHLQSNKVKYIIPFVHLIHGVDSLRLLKEIDRQAARIGRVADVLLQVFIAREETKFGFDPHELADCLRMVRGTDTAARDVNQAGTGDAPEPGWKNVRIRGLMGMASFTEDPGAVRAEFKGLRKLFETSFPADGILSMGMSGDYKIAVEEGATMVRIGSLLFGKRGA